MTRIETAQNAGRTESRSPRGRTRARIAGMVLVLAVMGCDRDEGVAETGAVGDSAAIDGLSPEQLEQQAQPMSREQAEQLGIIDSTEAAPPSPVGPGSVVPGAGTDSAAPPAPQE